MNHTTENIRELTTEQNYKEAFVIIQQLRTHLKEQSYLEMLSEMANEGYRLFALYDDNKIAAVAGIAIKTNFYYGKHVFVYDLVTDSRRRSNGFGQQLLKFIHQFGKEQGCQIVALESGLHRVDAHRFYEEKMGYARFCYSFKKTLT